jgi:hypothetical protein
LKVVVVLGDGSRHPIALRTGKSRWEDAEDVALGLIGDDSAATVELHAQGGVAHVWHAASLAPEAEPDEGDEGDEGDEHGREMAMLRLMLTAQDHAVDRFRGMLREERADLLLGFKQMAENSAAALRSFSDLMGVMTARVGQLESGYANVLQLALDATLARREDDDSEVTELLKTVLAGGAPAQQAAAQQAGKGAVLAGDVVQSNGAPKG